MCVCVCVNGGKLEAGGWQTKVREGREEKEEEVRGEGGREAVPRQTAEEES